MAFAVEPSAPAPGASVLTLRGELDFRAEPILDDALTGARAPSSSLVALDLGAITSVDGSGLTVLFKAGLRARRAGLRLAAFGLPARCRDLLRELGFEGHMAIYPSLERALGLADPGNADPRRGSQKMCSPEEWAGPLGRAVAPRAPGHFAPHLVDHLPVQTPASGFGQLWHKVYEVGLPGAGSTPPEIAALLRTELSDLWPRGAELVLPSEGFAPGASGIIRMRLPGGAPLVTGVRVLHAGAVSFTFATLQGHMEAGWIAFRAYEGGDAPVARVESFARTGDPLHELGFRLFGHAAQERFWQETLGNLARRFGTAGRVRTLRTCLDKGRQWKGVRNLPANAAARTVLWAAAGLASRLFGGRRGP